MYNYTDFFADNSVRATLDQGSPSCLWPTPPTDFKFLWPPISKWLNEAPIRVPLTDWYDTNDRKQMGFQAHFVVGGVYIKALANSEITKKWQHKAKPEKVK